VVASITEAVTRGDHDIEYRIIRPDGLVRWVAGKGQVIRDETGRPARLIGICTDVTERKDVEDQLRRANEAKDEFLGLISHELRTPITTIYGGARLLHSRAGQLDTDSHNSLLADIESESERLHRLVEDLLVLSRLELNQRVATEPVLLQHVIQKAAEASRKRNRQVTADIPAGLPAVAAEPTYLDQVLRNLLSNAEKYSTAGEPIEIAVTRNGATEATVTVSDRGPGVPDEEAERIFDRFFRSKHTAGKVGGAGIGLTVCKRLIEAQAGRIWACPREGGGLAVSFALPLSEEVIE
jgi:signal transduction histidine kinase